MPKKAHTTKGLLLGSLSFLVLASALLELAVHGEYTPEHSRAAPMYEVRAQIVVATAAHTSKSEVLLTTEASKQLYERLFPTLELILMHLNKQGEKRAAALRPGLPHVPTTVSTSHQSGSSIVRIVARSQDGQAAKAHLTALLDEWNEVRKKISSTGGDVMNQITTQALTREKTLTGMAQAAKAAPEATTADMADRRQATEDYRYWKHILEVTDAMNASGEPAAAVMERPGNPELVTPRSDPLALAECHPWTAAVCVSISALAGMMMTALGKTTRG